MKIHNLRIGFATNSSSSHSVVLLPKGISASEEGDVQDSYGWEDFRLTTTESKIRYLAAQMFSNSADAQTVINLVEHYIPDYQDTTDLNIDSWDSPSVDHQSVIRNFVPEELLNLFLNDRVVILGGNDNSEGTEYNVEGQTLLIEGETSIRAKFELGNIVVFNDRTGEKIRIGNDNSSYDKSITPELVDLKITDYCDKGCNFCYQSSTEDGKHADYDKIIKILDMLEEMKVFEVAIGGGEPTTHPRFHDILQECAKRNITPNFTTLSDKWILDDFDYDIVGGIGVSVSNIKALELVKSIRSKLWKARVQVMAQHVMESVPIDVTARLLNAAKNNRTSMLLLGFKDVGFGTDYQRHEGDSLILKLALEDFSKGYFNLSVDTAFVDQYPDVLDMLGTPKVLTSSPEGKFSCYIDAVEDRMGMSSYIQTTDMDDLVFDVDDFKDIYAKY